MTGEGNSSILIIQLFIINRKLQGYIIPGQDIV